jgi:hypothetical protein
MNVSFSRGLRDGCPLHVVIDSDTNRGLRVYGTPFGVKKLGISSPI